MHVLITVVEHCGDGKQFDPELRTRFLAPVDNPPIPVIVRINICVGKFHHVHMAQAREGAEDEGIPVDACPIVGEPDIHDSLQFRSREVATFRVLRPDVETCERIGGNPAVLIRRVGHQLQFLDSRMDRPGTHPLYRGEVDHKLFDEIPLQLFERNIFYTVFVFEERGSLR